MYLLHYSIYSEIFTFIHEKQWLKEGKKKWKVIEHNRNGYGTSWLFFIYQKTNFNFAATSYSKSPYPYPCSPSHIFISIFIFPYVLITQQYLCPKRKTNHSASYLYLALDPEAKCFIPHWIFAILNGFGPDSLRGGSGQGQAYVAISLANCIWKGMF